MLALSWAFAPAATAGGPTSVLLVAPSSAMTASLYYSDEEYGTLTDLLNAPDPGGATEPKEPNLDATMEARQINVTWMVHDVTPWRLDRVYAPVESKTVWIHTSESAPGFTTGAWHRADQPARLKALLKKLGMMGPVSDKGSGPVPPADDPTSPTTRTATVSVSTPDKGSGDTTDWWWAIPGLAVGAGLALGLRPFVVRLLARPRGGTRQELRDV
ncbi:hypothetical protein [Streptomyces sp. NBC_01465]|uniref:hypothetical protein n=1 Tax=Streptomyces sp. NBC_01465 TaxID=2903878 RepID=UPI002E3035D1|nr:hypothetical protein [Streptomyces sp. NBC_01465]